MKRIAIVAATVFLFLTVLADNLGTQLYPTPQMNGRYGYITPTGYLAIAAKFDDARAFREGFAAVEVGSKWGFIRENGRYLVRPKYKYVEDFNNGYAIVRDSHDKFGAIDTEGREVVPCQYDRQEDLLDAIVVTRP